MLIIRWNECGRVTIFISKILWRVSHVPVSARDSIERDGIFNPILISNSNSNSITVKEAQTQLDFINIPWFVCR